MKKLISLLVLVLLNFSTINVNADCIDENSIIKSAAHWETITRFFIQENGDLLLHVLLHNVDNTKNEKTLDAGFTIMVDKNFPLDTSKYKLMRAIFFHEHENVIFSRKTFDERVKIKNNFKTIKMYDECFNRVVIKFKTNEQDEKSKSLGTKIPDMGTTQDK